MVTKIMWLKCCDQNFLTKILWPKFVNPLKSRSDAQPLGAPNFGGNSECFVQKLIIWSKTQSFGVTKNSERMVTLKLVKNGIVLNSHIN